MAFQSCKRLLFVISIYSLNHSEHNWNMPKITKVNVTKSQLKSPQLFTFLNSK